MAEHTGSGEKRPVDRDLNLKGIVVSVLGLTILLVATAALMWPLARSLRALAEAADPPPPVLFEARTQPLPPEPRLQVAPEEEMRQMRAEENELLGGWSWLDETSGIARVPIERAMELVAERGLQPGPVPPSAEEAP